MKASRPILAAAAAVLAAGSYAVGGAAAATPTPPTTGAGCIDPATAPTTAAPATTQPASPTTPPAGGVPFTSPDGDFSVTFPGQPTDQSVPGTGAETAAWGYIDGARGYIVSRSTLGTGQTIDLRMGCEGAVAEIGATLVSSAAITVDGHLGIEFVAATPDGATAVQRIIDGGSAMYQLVATEMRTLTAADPAVAAFFGSFHLTAPAGAPGTESTAATAPATEITVAAVPTIAIPTIAVPIPTIAVPTIAIPTVVPAPSVATDPTVAVPTAVAPPSGWISYTSPTDGYTVALPAEPEIQTLDQPTVDGGTVPISQAFVDAGERAWSVSFFQLPPDGTFDIEAGRDGSLGDFGATLVSSVPIEYAGRSGLEFVGTFLQDGEPATIVSRLFVDGDRVHQLIALAFGTVDASDPEIAGFFGSLVFAEVANG